jgi:hypothetical protein
MAEARSSWLTPKRRIKRDKLLPDGILRRTVWKDGRPVVVYIKDGKEYSGWFEACIGGFVEPPLTK